MKYSLVLTSIWFLISCEDSPSLATGSQQTSTIAMRMGGDQVIDDKLDSFVEDDMALSNRIDDDEIDMGDNKSDMEILDEGAESIDDMMAVDVALIDQNQPIDMMDQIICIEDELRQQRECGYERCIDGEWITVTNTMEECNTWDDDCDGLVDEDPSPQNQMSECCDNITCVSRAYCSAGQCNRLRQNECRFDGDCEGSSSCIDELCSLYTIDPPRNSATCDAPILAIVGDNSLNGHNASFLFSANRCGDEEFRQETIDGAEMIYRLNIFAQGRYTFTSWVTNGFSYVPSSISLLSSCSPMAAPLWCYSTETESQTTEGTAVSLRNNVMFDLTPGRYFIIVDTHYQKLYEILSENNQQLSDLNYILNISQR